LTIRRPIKTNTAHSTFAYNSFLRLKLENSFDINKSHEEEGQPFGNITAEMEITPGRALSLDADASWSPYDSEFKSHNASLGLWNDRGDRFNATYRYTRETTPEQNDGIASILLDGELGLNPEWRVRAGYEYNLFDNKEIEGRLGLSYQAQCWGFDLTHIAGRTSRSYVVVIHLTGLGSIGQ
jgi:lipopolysaccharide assembly outer membrane protein LptD (OstA)